MMHRKEVWAALIVVVGVAAILVYFAVNSLSEVAVIQANNESQAMWMNSLSGVDTSQWQTYTDPDFGFSLRYPSNWQISTFGLSSEAPFIVIGNPLTGTTTYAMYVSVMQDPQALNSGDFVHQTLAAARAQDAANASSGPAPTVTPRFTHAYVTTAGTNGAYELYGVFEFDHNGEQIYVAHGTIALKFDFPVADENPNLSAPANNNAVAHMIVNTLTFQ